MNTATLGARGRGRGFSALAILTLAALLCSSPPAQASYDPIGSAATKITFDKGFLAFLKRDGVRLSASAPARLKAGAVTLPASGGVLDPTIGKGTVEQEGVLVFQNSRNRLPLKGIVLKTAHAPLIAKVGGSQLKVATAAKLSTARQGFGSQIRAKDLKLTAKVATRLNKKMRPPTPFVSGQLIGQLSSSTEPLTTALLPSGSVRITPDPAFLAKLKSLFVSLNPIAPAVLEPGPVLSLPIGLESALSTDLSAGALHSGGAFELLQLHGGQIFLADSWLELPTTLSAELEIEPTPAFPGKLGRLPLLDLGAGAASADPSARTISLSAAPLTLQPKLASTLDQVFAEGKPVFNPGEALGSVSFTAQGQ